MKMEQEIEQKITRFLSEKTEIPAEELDPGTMLTEFGITSLQFLGYVAEIESMFDIRLSERDLNDIYTIHDLAEKVTKKCHERA